MLKILIADSGQELCCALAKELQTEYQVMTCRDGNTAWELLHSFTPDLLVVDLMLPGLDGVSLVEMAQQEHIELRVLAMSSLINQYVVEMMEQYQVGYLMSKPCDCKAVCMRARDLLTRKLGSGTVLRQLEEDIVCAKLIELGFSVKLRGFPCIVDAVCLMSRNLAQSVTKEIYPEVCKHMGGSSQQVERVIRNAINCAWKKRNVAQWRQYFPETSDGDVDRPTNAELICRLARMIRSEDKTGQK